MRVTCLSRIILHKLYRSTATMRKH